MKRFASSFALVAIIATFGSDQRAPRLGTGRVGTLHRESAGGSVIAAVVEPRGDVDEVKRAEVRNRVRQNEAGTYLPEILQERDSAIARWHDRPSKPLTVWVQPASRIAGWRPELVDRVRNAFQLWGDIQLPIQFAFVSDSTTAEVHVTWIDHFDESISGRTRWTRDDGWWITEANIVLAVHHQTGEILDLDAMGAISLHEIGHLIGLDHTSDPDAIMASKVRARALTDEDRATAKLLYSLPAGPLR